jgi:DNA-binding IclR family transcriptional regulator
MDVLADARTPMAFSEIAERTGFVKSSCHRILAVLAGEKLIEYDARTRTYKTGERLRNWSRSAWRRIDLQEIASPEMQNLSTACKLNVALSVLDDDTILYLRTVDHIPLRYAAASGDHAPLHCTAAGKVFIAYLTEERRMELLERLTFEKFTERTLTNSAALMNELPGIISKGYAMAKGEEFLQVTGMAVPIRGEDGKLVACLSAWEAQGTTGDRSIETYSADLMESAKRISKALGYVGD